MRTPIDRRLEIQELLEPIAGKGRVWFQPGSNVKLKYPCIVYSRNDIIKKPADNGTYMIYRAYKVTVIDDDPDSELVDKVSELPSCSFDTHYVSDNLNHDVFIIY